jgi:hypothetical protein
LKSLDKDKVDLNFVMTDIVHLNVGGVQYCVAKSTVMKFEDTMLANLISDKWISNNNSEEPIFIDRDGERFKYILDFYRDEEIIVPRTVSIEAVKKDALYFGLPENAIITESKKQNLFLGDIFSLRSSLVDIKKDLTLQILITNTQQFNKFAALWAVEEFLNLVTAAEFKTLPIEIRLKANIEKFRHIPGFDNRDGANLLDETMKIILTFEEEILSPSSLTVTFFNQIDTNPSIMTGYGYHFNSVLYFSFKT